MKLTILSSEEYISNSVFKTHEIAATLVQRLPLGTCIVLKGDLGAGKTVFVKGAASALGIDEDNVLSPTFVLHRRHNAKNAIVDHCDLYRLESAGEAKEAGILELFTKKDNLIFIEWADIIEEYLPKEYYIVELERLNTHSDARQIKISYIKKQ